VSNRVNNGDDRETLTKLGRLPGRSPGFPPSKAASKASKAAASKAAAIGRILSATTD
jgi:hypothetical protein